MKKQLLTAVFIILISGCSESDYVRFETAQPDRVRLSQSFNKKVQGEYLNCSNLEDRLIISEKLILNSQTFKFRSHKKDLRLGSTAIIHKENNDSLRSLFINAGYQINFDGDTVSGSLTNIDTIFQISKNQLLKKFKGSYFLNYKKNEDSWKVNQLNIKKDSLFIGEISPSDTLLRFNFIEKNKEFNESDSTTRAQYRINPTRREFKKLIKTNSFEKSSCYFKVK